MREHDKPRLAILRLVKNEIDIKEKESGVELSGEDVVATFKKVLKQTGETLEGSIKVGTNPERTELLRTQIEILNGYLPKQVTGDEIEAKNLGGTKKPRYVVQGRHLISYRDTQVKPGSYETK